MNTKIVTNDFGYSLSKVEDGVFALEKLIEVETTGDFYDGIKLSKAIPQVYDAESRKKNLQLSYKIIKPYL